MTRTATALSLSTALVCVSFGPALAQDNRRAPVSPLIERLQITEPLSRRPKVAEIVRQLPEGKVDLKPSAAAPPVACDITEELKGRGIETKAGAIPLLARTPCEVIRENINKQVETGEAEASGDLTVVTQAQARLFATNEQLLKVLPEGAMLAPIATTTDDGVRFSVTLPDAPDQLASVTLKELAPTTALTPGRIEVTFEPPETETLVTFMTEEPVVGLRHTGDLVLDLDNLNPDILAGLDDTEVCLGNQFGLHLNCFGASVALERGLEGEEPVTFGSAVLLDAEHGLYLTAWHVVEENRGVFSTAGGTSAAGFVNARFKAATGTEDAVDIVTIDERYEVIKTSATNVTVALNIPMDLFMFRAEPVDQARDPSLLVEARILAVPDDMTLREERGTHTVGVGYGGSVNQNGEGAGLRRFSRLAVGTCEEGGLTCVGPEWLVAGKRAGDPDSEDHAACPSDSGSPLFVEVERSLSPDDDPLIASVGVLSARMSAESVFVATDEDFCSPGLKYTDLTHPEVQAWIIENAAMLTGMPEADVIASIFIDKPVVLAPGLFAGLDLQ